MYAKAILLLQMISYRQPLLNNGLGVKKEKENNVPVQLKL